MPRSAKRKYNVKTIMKENLDYFVKLDEIYNCVKKKVCNNYTYYCFRLLNLGLWWTKLLTSSIVL